MSINSKEIYSEATWTFQILTKQSRVFLRIQILDPDYLSMIPDYIT